MNVTMKYCAMITLCCTITWALFQISSAQLYGPVLWKRYNYGDHWAWDYVEAMTNFIRHKNDEGRRAWNYFNIMKNIVQYKTQNDDLRRSSANNGDCSSYDPPKPIFKAPGRRISEEKCEEYKWNNLVKREQNKITQKCHIQGYAAGGRDTYLGEFPHMGAIGWKAINGGYIFRCGSTLISNKFVLTAAHCSRISDLDTSIADGVPKIIRLNGKNILGTSNKDNVITKDLNVASIIVHPEYKSPKRYFDIGLIELQEEVTFTQYMQPACLWTEPDVSKLGRDATLTGWGALRSGSHEISAELQAAVVNIINSSYCDELLYSSRNRNWLGLQDHQLCAGKLAGGVDACEGDSGGPLQLTQIISGNNVYHVIGVTSFGIGCALPNHPGIYTRVSSFIDWIEENVWP